jgi:hypothetical protein
MGREVYRRESMSTFLELEAGNLTIGAFFLLIALIVATRPFVRPSFKKGLFIAIISFFSLIIGGHYYITTQRMESVKSAFRDGSEVVCENRMHRKASQGIVISQETNWTLDGDLFINTLYNRPFHAARCIVKVKPKLALDK